MTVVLWRLDSESPIWEIQILFKNGYVDIEIGDFGQVFLCLLLQEREDDIYSVACFQMLMQGCVTSEYENILFVIVQGVSWQFT